MFRFNRTLFIISNYLLSFLSFILIFNLRYSWIDLTGIEKRSLNLITIFLFLYYSMIIIIFNISLKIYEINKISRLIESFFSNILVSVLSMGFLGIFFYFTQIKFARFVFFLGFLIIPLILSIYNKFLFVLLSKNKKPVKLLYYGSIKNYYLIKQLISEYSKWFKMDLKKIIMNKNTDILQKNLNRCDLLVIDSDQMYNNKSIDIINSYEIEGGKIYSLIDMFAYFDQSLPAELISNNYFDIFSYYKLDSFYTKYIKRVGDIIVSIILLLLTSPVFFLTALLIKISSQGKILYRQKRITVKNKEFYIYKFRTMKNSIEDNNFNFTKEKDKRITFIGRIIRSLRIDELPQLINILKGDMTFIGPRPERPEIINQILKKYPLFKKRLLVKPGLTGWAQVKYTYVNRIEKMNKKLSYDLYYINNLSFALDLKIFLYTIETVIFRRGAV